MDIEEKFKQATERVKVLVSTLNNAQLLYFYARFKQIQANEGPCTTSKPGFFEFEKKSKWDAWKTLGNMSKEKAMIEYVEQLNRVDPKWEEEMSQSGAMTSPGGGLGISVSKMQCDDSEDIDDSQKNIFDWCKEGNIKMVKSLLSTSSVNNRDEEGLSLLHWACDRGFQDVTAALLSSGADVNAQDLEGQTPLHFAASCEHEDIVQLLLKSMADVKLTDNEGLTALDACQNEQIRNLLSAK